jgi:hypothetical protein
LPFINFAAAAPIDCSPEAAAGRQSPPPALQGPPRTFRIFWHIGTQMEDLADAGDDARRTIAEVQKHVNGYYITVHPNQLGYWPTRPAQCAINFMRAKARIGENAVASLRTDCNRKFTTWLDSNNNPASGSTAQATYRDALQRALSNLNIKDEQAHGKTVIGQMLLARNNFNYDKTKRQLELRRLPTTYCFLNSAGLSVNNVLAYQEPGFQIRKGTFLSVPDSDLPSQTEDDRSNALPFNLSMIEQLANSFSRADVPLSRFSVNVRRWNGRMIDALRSSDRQNHIGGIFFEGGTEIISTKRRPTPRIDNFAEGIAWLLANSEQKIFLLMPGFWEKDELTSDQDWDDIIPRLRTTVAMLDQKIGQNLKLSPTEHAICNERLSFIPGTYGSPSHVKPLPAERNGKPAGTVAGQIMLLAQMRHELCGTPD